MAASSTGAEVTWETRSFSWKLLAKFNIYRIVLVSILLALILMPGQALMPQASPALFYFATTIYGIMAVIAAVAIRRHWSSFENIASALTFGDVFLITLLMHAAGGPSSGLGLLMLISIGECGVLLRRRLTIFFASFAAMAALVEHSWELLTRQPIDLKELAQGYPSVGFLGLALFVTASLGNTLAARQRSAAALAERRGLALSNLSNINDLIIDRMQSGVIVCDPSGHIEAVNRAAHRFLSQNIIKGKSLSDSTAVLAESLRAWAVNPDGPTPSSITLDSGYTVVPRFTLLGSPENRVGYVIFLEDADILRQQAQQLKIAALARLTSSIAHEIRNPLSAISSAAQLMHESPANDSESQRLLKIIENHSKRMDTIVENITQLGRRDRTDRMRLNAYNWLTEFTQHFSQSIAHPKEALAYEIEDEALQLCVDPDQLFQVMVNLCQNALNHSPPFTGETLVWVRAYMGKERRPIIDVMDRGSGISPENVDSIFDPFFTTSALGTGLGLYISRELCEANGARMSYVAREGGGSIFRLSFAHTADCEETLPQ